MQPRPSTPLLADVSLPGNASVLPLRPGQITAMAVNAGATADGQDVKRLRHWQQTEAAVFQRGRGREAGREQATWVDQLSAGPLSNWWVA